jgi:PadR family transcriptional regulator
MSKMKHYKIGEFEEIVLLIVASLTIAYANKIIKELKSKLNRTASLSTVHITLYRLEDKGFLKSSWGEPTDKRGGRRKRIYEMTSFGMDVLKEIKLSRTQLWSAIPELK